MAVYAGPGEAGLLPLEVGGHEPADDHEDRCGNRGDEGGFGEVCEIPHYLVEYRALHAAGEHGAEIMDEVVFHQHWLECVHRKEQNHCPDKRPCESGQYLFARSVGGVLIHASSFPVCNEGRNHAQRTDSRV